MVTRVHAIYRNGAFFPECPLSVPDGAKVELTVESSDPPAALAAALDKIADLPREGTDDGFSGADHDRVLYPKRGGR